MSDYRPIDSDVYNEAKSLGLTSLQANIVSSRISIKDNIDIESLINPSLSKIPDPMLMKDMDKAVNRLADAIINNELIAVSTDFDTDGCSSCAVIKSALVQCFRVPETSVIVHVSDRMKHGYGLSPGAVDSILSASWDRPPTVVITADHGSSDKAGIEHYLKRMSELGSIGDVIVTDHHEIPEEGPPDNAYAVCNPKREDCSYPETWVCGGLIAYFLIGMVAKELISRGWIEKSKHGILLSYSGLATIGDMMDLRQNTNRAVVNFALEKMNKQALPAWSVIKQSLEDGESITEETLGFFISPAVNSASRMGYDGINAVNYLMAPNYETAQKKFDFIKSSNAERQNVEAKLLDGAIEKAQTQYDAGRRSIIIHLDEGHAGVNGIVCSRIKERFNRPTMVLSTVGNLFVGSCRSLPGFDFRMGMSRVFKENKGIAIKYGGHSQAAGLSVNPDRVEDLVRLFEEYNAPYITDEVLGGKISHDGVLFEDVSVHADTLDEISQLAPYGQKFETPIFLLKGYVSNFKIVGSKQNHAKITITNEYGSISGIWFKVVSSASDEIPVANGDYVEVLTGISWNYFRGNKTIQCKINSLVQKGN